MSRFLPDDLATEAVGGEIASTLRPGDIVLLEGDLGAGKTALARAMIRALAGDADLEVPSPTFALVQPYQVGQTPILHADLYRIGDPREIEELGLLDAEDGIVLVEWAERAPELFDLASHIVRLAVPADGVGRTVAIETRNRHGR